MIRLRAACLALGLVLVACAREHDDSRPEGAVALFLDALERGREDPRALEEAYALIDDESQRRLMERARSATALGGREYEPWEMLVEGRSRVRFAPRRGSGVRLRESREGRATVLVTGEGEDEHAEIAVVLEDDGWRVVLGVPELRSEPASEP